MRQFLVAEVDGDVVSSDKRGSSPARTLASANRPGGWYLSGVTVTADQRRRGMGLALTEARLERLSGEVVYYAAEPETEHATIRMHERLGFGRGPDHAAWRRAITDTVPTAP